MDTRNALLPLLAALALAACSEAVELLGRLPESDANAVVAALDAAGIEAHKSETKTGFVVRVDAPRFAQAVAVLQLQGLPRHAYAQMGEVFKKDGMISTPLEERSRYLFALSQGLEDTLGRIDGVLLARVHPVLPERVAPGEPVLPSSCAVLIKHRPGWDSVRYEQRIRQLVLASIPGLARQDPGKVSVVFVAADDSAGAEPVSAAAPARARGASETATGSPLWAAVLGLGALVLGGWAWQQQRVTQPTAPADGSPEA